MYAVIASIRHETEMGADLRRLPIFYINSDRTVDEVEEIARKVVDPFRQYDHRLTLSVERIRKSA